MPSDVVTYTTALRAGGLERLEPLLAAMQRDALRPNLVTYTAAMSVCGEAPSK